MKQGRHVVFDTWQGKWLEEAVMPTGEARISVTKWTRHRERAYRFPSLQAARNMAEALGGMQFEVRKRD